MTERDRGRRPDLYDVTTQKAEPTASPALLKHYEDQVNDQWNARNRCSPDSAATCYIERSKVREILIQHEGINSDTTGDILEEVDALQIFTADDFAPAQAVGEDWSCAADFLDEIEVDANGVCRWSDVANAQTNIRMTLRSVQRAPPQTASEPVAWQWRYVGTSKWMTPSGGKKFMPEELMTERQIEQRPLYAPQPQAAPLLPADFTQMFPGGKLDDSTYEKIETALDRIEAPSTIDGKWLSLHERIAALARPQAAPQAAYEADLETRVVEAITECVGETTHVHALAAAREAIMIVRAEPQGAPTRDEIARIIDPTAWKLEDGYFIEQAHADVALQKADTILALSRPQQD